MPRESAGAPAVLLIVSGVLGLIYAAGYFLWSIVGVLWGGWIIALDMSSKGFHVDQVLGQVLAFLLMPVVQLALFALCMVTSVVTLLGGVRYMQFRSRGLVVVALGCSLLTPLLGALANGTAMLNCSMCGIGGLIGCMLGNLGTAPVALVGFVATVVGGVMITDERYAAAFAENAENTE